MKKDGYKITVKASSDYFCTLEQVYYPRRKFKNIQEILDYTTDRVNPRYQTKRLEFDYIRVSDPYAYVYKGLLRNKPFPEFDLRLTVRIENMIKCGFCGSVFARYEHPELNSRCVGFENLSCRECGRNFVFG